MKIHWHSSKRYGMPYWEASLLGATADSSPWNSQLRLSVTITKINNAKGQEVLKYTGRIKGAHTEVLFRKKNFVDVHAALNAVTDEFAARVSRMLQHGLPAFFVYTTLDPSIKTDDVRSDAVLSSNRNVMVERAGERHEDLVTLEVVAINNTRTPWNQA